MNDINTVVVTGKLTRDAERYEYASSTKYTFSVAVSKRVKKNNEWTDSANFFDIEAWNLGKLADGLTKGRPIVVEGELDTYTYEKDGKKFTKTFIKANSIQYYHTGKKNETAPASQTQTPASDNWDDGDDIPF